MSATEPSPAEIESVEGALLKAYGLSAFKMMTYHRMGIRLEEEVDLRQGFKFVVHDFVDLAVRGGWLPQLIRSAVAGQPGNFALAAVAKSLGVAASPQPIVPASEPVAATNPVLEKLIRSRSTLLNFQAFLDACMRLTRQLCTIEIPQGNPVGTGWLVASDLLLTNYHVVDALDLHTALPQDVVCVFDRLHDGSAVTICGLADPWRISYSRTAREDIALNAPAAPADELDYALVRLARAIGDEAVTGSAERRGWVTLKANPPAAVERDVVLVVQHPEGRPLEAAFGNVLDYNSTSTRIRYDANTDGGSSGSPCLTVELEPVALHNVGGPGDERKYNQGVPIRRIIEDLKAKNVSAFWADS